MTSSQSLSDEFFDFFSDQLFGQILLFALFLYQYSDTSSILWGYLVHFLSPSLKKFLIFQEMGLSRSNSGPDTSISGIEKLLLETNLRSKKWPISGSYNPHLNSIQNHLVQLSKKIPTLPNMRALWFRVILTQKWQTLTKKSFVQCIIIKDLIVLKTQKNLPQLTIY